MGFLKDLRTSFGTEPTSEDIFYYVYAVLYSPFYRTRYEDLIKIDFPKIPFTSNYDLFTKIAELGKKLVDLHLMKSDELDVPITKFHGDGDNIVKKISYSEMENRAFINKTQYFDGIEKDVWQYYIGANQVLYKWLKDRKSRKLSLEDIKHYCKVVTALKKTIEMQDEIDKLYPDVEKNIIEFRENNEQNAGLEKYAK